MIIEKKSRTGLTGRAGPRDRKRRAGEPRREYRLHGAGGAGLESSGDSGERVGLKVILWTSGRDEYEERRVAGRAR